METKVVSDNGSVRTTKWVMPEKTDELIRILEEWAGAYCMGISCYNCILDGYCTKLLDIKDVLNKRMEEE